MRLTKIRRITLLILVFVICLIPASGRAYNLDSTDAYVFPFVPNKMTRAERDDFYALSYEERLQLLQVPDSFLRRMSTEGLIETCLNYPKYSGVGIYSINFQEEFEKAVSEFNGLRECLQRSDVSIKLLERYKQTPLETPASLGIDIATYHRLKGKKNKINVVRKEIRGIEMLLAQEVVLSNFREEERRELLKTCLENVNIKNEYLQIYRKEDKTWIVMGRILQKENFEPFIQKMEEDENIKIFIERGIQYALETSVNDEILKMIAAFTELFFQENPKGDTQK